MKTEFDESIEGTIAHRLFTRTGYFEGSAFEALWLCLAAAAATLDAGATLFDPHRAGRRGEPAPQGAGFARGGHD